jgi:DNA repair ATPase RecN
MGKNEKIMTALYELTDQYNKALTELLDIEGLDDESFNDTMEALELELEDKLFNTAAYMQNIEADAKALKEAEDRIKARRIIIENKAKRLKEYVRFNLELSGIPKIERAEFKLSLRKGVKSVNVKEESLVPEKYIVTKTIKSVDKKLAAKALRSGEVIKGLELKRGKSSLSIK